VSSVRRIAICLLASFGLLLASVLPASAETGGVPFTVELTGGAEVPGPGDLDGSGTASLTINPGLDLVCSTIKVAGIDDITAAHIHVGSPDVAGPVVVPLSTDGCTVVDRELALAIIKVPSSYYVNVHTALFDAGALRGQLDRVP
jgi:hypothetical protein